MYTYPWLMKAFAPADPGELTILTVRVPAGLRARVDRWAALRGESSAQAIRSLLSEAAEDAPGAGLVIRPPLKSMFAYLRELTDSHRLLSRSGIRDDHTAWAAHPEKWALVRIADEDCPRWAEFDSLLQETIGSRHVTYAYEGFCRVSVASLPALAEAFRGNERALTVHHLESGRGTYLVSPPATEKGD